VPLLVRSRQDPDAFASFYEQYAKRVVVFFIRRTFDPEISLDLAAETFALALERRRQFRGRTPEEEQGWLFAIARSVLSHFWRNGDAERSALGRVGVQPPGMESDEIRRLEDLAGLAELREAVRRAVTELSAEQAYAVEQRVLVERSYAELATELRVSEQVVRARVSRGLRLLADRLGERALEDVA
jgi:RNA polymerase sigma factor (sigma-70 family)